MSIIQALHDSPWRGVFHITGGGVSLLTELLAVPGASRTLLDATIPYANQALTTLLGKAPEQAASVATARALAMAAFQRAQAIGGEELFGLGCTASLSTDRQKRGLSRAHWAIQTTDASYDFYLDLTAQTHRMEQEQFLREALLQSLGSALLGKPATSAQTKALVADASWRALLNVEPYRWCSGGHDGELILPGSFNPAHQGHYQMLEVAEQLTSKAGAFELTLRNADKPNLDYLSAQERVLAIRKHDIWLTNQANFSAKAELFPAATFALGTDTMARIADPRFYQYNNNAMDTAIQRLHDLNVHFLVFGRAAGGQFIGLDDLALPRGLGALCQAVPESTYRNDQSSTQIRAQALSNGRDYLE